MVKTEDLADTNNDDAPICPSLMISMCCGAPPLGYLDEDAFGRCCGICSECKHHALFEKDLAEPANA